MTPIAQQDDRPVWLVEMRQEDPFRSPCAGEEFAALIAVYDSGVSDDSRSALSAALIGQGCRNGVCWGHDCSGWDDALDWAFLATDPDFDPPDERFVMTSWFEDEPLEEAVFFLLRCSAFDGFEPRNFVVLALGDAPREEILAAVRSKIADTDGDSL